MEKNNLDDIKDGFDRTFSINSTIRRKRKTATEQKKQAFIDIIEQYEENLLRSTSLGVLCGIDTHQYDDSFFKIIDELFLLSYGVNVFNLIEFYLYERVGNDGVENFIQDADGKFHSVRTPLELYNLIEKFYPNTF